MMQVHPVMEAFKNSGGTFQLSENRRIMTFSLNGKSMSVENMYGHPSYITEDGNVVLAKTFRQAQQQAFYDSINVMLQLMRK